MIKKLVSSTLKNYIPNAYTFAVLLSFIVFIIGVLWMRKTPTEMISFWGDHFFDLLKFSSQMALILVCGFCLAKTKFVIFLLQRLSSLINNQFQAAFLITMVAIVSCYINWGFGLIVSGMIAKACAKKIRNVHFGFLLACAYSGFLVWHAGLSGSIPLKASGQSPILDSLSMSSISLSQTIFSSFNITLLLLVSLTIIVVNLFCSKFYEGDTSLKDDEVCLEIKAKTASEKLEQSVWFKYAFCFFFCVYLIQYFYTGRPINLNIMILIFMFLGIVLSRSLFHYMNLFSDSIKGASGIFLQFPLYAGIMGMMSQSGMAEALSHFFISISDENTFLFNTYLSAGIVNFFVPSGGGQWVIQGPIILKSALGLGVDPAKASMAIAWGDAWTNMIQPFWALPLLSIAGLEIKDMICHCLVVFLAVGTVSSLYLIFY